MRSILAQPSQAADRLTQDLRVRPPAPGRVQLATLLSQDVIGKVLFQVFVVQIGAERQNQPQRTYQLEELHKIDLQDRRLAGDGALAFAFKSSAGRYSAALA